MDGDHHQLMESLILVPVLKTGKQVKVRQWELETVGPFGQLPNDQITSNISDLSQDTTNACEQDQTQLSPKLYAQHTNMLQHFSICRQKLLIFQLPEYFRAIYELNRM